MFLSSLKTKKILFPVPGFMNHLRDYQKAATGFCTHSHGRALWQRQCGVEYCFMHRCNTAILFLRYRKWLNYIFFRFSVEIMVMGLQNGEASCLSLACCLACFSTLKMDTIRYSETSSNFYRTTSITSLKNILLSELLK
jgi:hypothetical protein